MVNPSEQLFTCVAVINIYLIMPVVICFPHFNCHKSAEKIDLRSENEAFNVESANDAVDFVFPDTCCTVAADKSFADTTWFIKIKRLAMKLKLVKKLMIMVVKL